MTSELHAVPSVLESSVNPAGVQGTISGAFLAQCEEAPEVAADVIASPKGLQPEDGGRSKGDPLHAETKEVHEVDLLSCWYAEDPLSHADDERGSDQDVNESAFRLGPGPVCHTLSVVPASYVLSPNGVGTAGSCTAWPQTTRWRQPTSSFGADAES